MDASDRLVGRVPRGRVLRIEANFRTCHVFVFNSRGELLLQQLAPNRDRFPGRWGSSVAGYLHAGEGYAHAARRRQNEELGLAGPLYFVGKTRMVDGHSYKFVSLFSTAAGAKPQIKAPEQIAQVSFWSLRRIEEKMAEDIELFTPTFVHVFRFYQAERRLMTGRP